ncbi:MAG: type II secretion system F family protein [Nanoarchaeota archaeon]|nr:type II secretion system F family protein [Nanoarchaeota archaeon]MBU1103813.1 type II secretion system F family protein [Nanoarchaeota archaeon]
MALKKMHWFGIIAGVVIALFDFVFFYKNEKMLFFLLGIGIGIIALPFIIGLSLENKKEHKVDDMFLEFTRNLAESVATGTPISKGVINMRKKNYGVLNPHVNKLANQIELGIPVDEALQTFAKELDSTVVKRAIALIREAEKAGGDIDYILDSTAKSICEVEKLKKERRAVIYGLVVQGYVIFFIFIGIILIMEFKIIPLTAGVSTFGGLGGAGDLGSGAAGVGEISPEQFTKPFLYLLLAQGLFVGLVIGKLTEGSIKKGLKHSFILMITAFLISTGARLFLSGG